MDDSEIIELYWARSETALRETERKYAKQCHSVAYNILKNREDAEECVNDTLERAWNAIPPARPEKLAAFLLKITRNLSLDRYDAAHAQKRGSGSVAAAIDELAECLPDASANPDAILEGSDITAALNAFLSTLSPETRRVFMRRYWFADSINDIAQGYGLAEAKVKSILFRARKKLKSDLDKEGIIV
ncbi:MAG: sigma-70 family RNA polymerase sigma factor [Oscillospiraceae bacterium]|jgi:RNA polymerase sigma-70 factor (ECF subfamily)|nr:sigma-70 family RNA polymerase sigma factor [Oscillospiraceae bacterium]